MKIIKEIKNKHPEFNLVYKMKQIEGFNEPFHSLYINEDLIISIMDGYEPKTGKERKEIFDIVKVNLNLSLEK
jgi:hypothetical protein